MGNVLAPIKVKFYQPQLITKDIKMLFHLNHSNKQFLEKVKEVSLADVDWTEKDLENLIASNVENLIRADQLFVIAQGRKRQEDADIMALDSNGVLFLFELKRWKSHEDNLLQVLRYGQKFGRYDYARLNNLFQTYKLRYDYDKLSNLFQSYKHGNIEKSSSHSLQEAHQKYFNLDNRLSEIEFNKKQRFVIVTNGLDISTWGAIDYWKKYDLPIEALIYRIYKDNDSGGVFMDFDPYGPDMEALDYAGEGLFVVNTNVTYDSDAYKEMLSKNKASAYWNRKHGITSIKKGSSVCLYHTGIGVIAIGKATSDYMQCPYDGSVNEEYFVSCEFEYKIDPIKEGDKAIKASEINQNFETGHKFRQTVFTLPSTFDEFIRESFKGKI